MYLDYFKANHSTTSIAMSLEQDGIEWIKACKEDFSITHVSLFFEKGTPTEKIERHNRVATDNNLIVRNCFTAVPTDEINRIIEYANAVNAQYKK